MRADVPSRAVPMRLSCAVPLRRIEAACARVRVRAPFISRIELKSVICHISFAPRTHASHVLC